MGVVKSVTTFTSKWPPMVHVRVNVTGTGDKTSITGSVPTKCLATIGTKPLGEAQLFNYAQGWCPTNKSQGDMNPQETSNSKRERANNKLANSPDKMDAESMALELSKLRHRTLTFQLGTLEKSLAVKSKSTSVRDSLRAQIAGIEKD